MLWIYRALLLLIIVYRVLFVYVMLMDLFVDKMVAASLKLLSGMEFASVLSNEHLMVEHLVHMMILISIIFFTIEACVVIK